MDSVKIRRCATPIVLKQTKKPESAILAIHGFAGYPGELALVAKTLFNGGFDIFVPRLPGHGTNGSDFESTGNKEWLASCEEHLLTLLETYKNVSIVGHSMGGSLALILATKYNIKKVVLFSPALIVNQLNPLLINIASLFIKKKHIGWQADPRYKFFDERDADDDQYLGLEYWSYLYMEQIKGLAKISKESLVALKENKSSILVFTGTEDVRVPKKVGSIIYEHDKENNKWINFDKGTHLIPYDIEDEVRAQAMEETVKWLKQ
ncbi:MAG: alpha/beta fold hydrolase [Sphaerochaetaceae bacterium]